MAAQQFVQFGPYRLEGASGQLWRHTQVVKLPPKGCINRCCTAAWGSHSGCRAISALHHELFWDMAHWLGRKYKISMPEVMQKYRIGNTFSTKTIQLVMPTTFTAKRLRTKPWHNPYTEKEAIIREKLLVYDELWTGKEDRPGWKDLREEAPTPRHHEGARPRSRRTGPAPSGPGPGAGVSR
jgi:hypothetical protein